MDKKVIFAVAGSGKTTYIIDQLSLEKRSLVVTYTINNLKNLRDGIVKKFGYFPSNIRLHSYFTFIYTFCYRPFLSLKFVAKGINYDPNPYQFAKQTETRYFFDRYGRIYSNRIAKILELERVLRDVNSRLVKYFDDLFIDEIQDFAGHDFNFLKSISSANIDMTFVGDFYQHTFDTSRDGKVNENLHNDYNNYRALFANMGMAVDIESLKRSYRCSPTICNFITENIGIEIFSNRGDETKIHFLETPEKADEIFQNRSIVKLFYQEHYKYGCYSRNWGECKGENKYDDVCVVLNKTTLSKFKDKLFELPSQTKNKLYVACTRAKNDLYFVSDCFYKKYKTQKDSSTN
jgi:DNA helicase II / ATP-dependent DNA helicase PcrA